MNYRGIKDTLFVCKNCRNKFPFKGYSSNNIFCSIKCNREYKSKAAKDNFEAQYLLWISGADLGLKNPRALIRKFVAKRDGYECSCCGIAEWRGKEIALWCDHINGNATDNSPSNFRLLCPNCDSQSNTFGAKNYGKGRKSRGVPQYG